MIAIIFTKMVMRINHKKIPKSRREKSTVFSGKFLHGVCMGPAAESLYQAFCDVVDKSFGVGPSKAGVGDGLAVAVLADFLAAWLKVAFDHDALDHLLNLAGMAAVEHLLDNPNLFLVLLAGVGMVGIYDAGRILKVTFAVQLMKKD